MKSEPAIAANGTGMLLNNESYVPYYQQIVEQVRAMVRSEKVREGQTFCSESDLAQYLGTSKMPVRQAYQKLRSEGLLVIAKGKRPVIGSGRLPWNFQQLRGFSEEMHRRGLQPSARVLSNQLVGAEGEVAKALRLEDGKSVYRIFLPIHVLFLHHAKLIADFLVYICKECVGQLVLGAKLGLGLRRVAGDAEHHGARRLQLLERVAEAAGLNGAARSVCPGVKEEDDGLAVVV